MKREYGFKHVSHGFLKGNYKPTFLNLFMQSSTTVTFSLLLCAVQYSRLCDIFCTNQENSLKLKLKKPGGLSVEDWLVNLLKTAACTKERVDNTTAFSALTLFGELTFVLTNSYLKNF